MIGLTRLNNYAGLNGFYIIHDSNENKLIAHPGFTHQPGVSGDCR